MDGVMGGVRLLRVMGGMRLFIYPLFDVIASTIVNTVHTRLTNKIRLTPALFSLLKLSLDPSALHRRVLLTYISLVIYTSYRIVPHVLAPHDGPPLQLARTWSNWVYVGWSTILIDTDSFATLSLLYHNKSVGRFNPERCYVQTH